eukprot:gnl/MRDRNA2_/MRDRNA2_79585_c0_seq2.p1 gnl/MRDRNA2_/MRDRNA2_79585_c0~~gnl/MRDRNA2_/MRDRNA2_79585_c0_seq2.p1  ORF type:complete len:404 (-),score=52.99 gnl/MRDRNA2_/MRDRNA2_79585_c0_seq2:201-1313(-)
MHDAPSDLSTASGDNAHCNDGSEDVMTSLQTDEGASVPPLMDLHRLRTDEESYFSQSVIPSMMTCMQTDEEAGLPQSSIPPLMDLHRLQTDEDAYFSQYVVGSTCDTGLHLPMTTAPAMTSAPTMTSSSSPLEDAPMVLGLSALLESSYGNMMANAADANPSSPSQAYLPSGYVTCGSINEPFPSASSVAPTLWPTVPSSVHECTDAGQPQLIKPCPIQGNTAQKPADKSLEKQSKRISETCSKGGPVPTEGPTTLMIRGIPCSITQEELMELMDQAGLKGKYDFFYLPTDRTKSTGKKSVNLGYAFVNFTDHQSAEHCTTTFRDVPLAPGRSQKKCAISPADVQGIPSLKDHFKRAAVMSRGAHGPIFL